MYSCYVLENCLLISYCFHCWIFPTPFAVFNVIAEKTVTVTNEEQCVKWEGYGLRICIPSNALPEHCSEFQLKMEVALSGRFKLPGHGHLVSAIYSFSPSLGKIRLKRPVSLKMQHFASTDILGKNQLHIIRATEGAGVTCKFDTIPGGVFLSKGWYN